MTYAVRDSLSRRSRSLGTGLAVVAYFFLLAPIFVVVPIAFGTATELTFPPTHFSIELFRLFFHSASWISSLVESLKVAVASMVVVMLIGTPAGYGLARHEFAGKGLVAGSMLGTLVIPTIVTGLGLYLYFSYIHIVGTTPALVLGHVMYTLPYVVVMIIAGVRKLDPNLEFGAELMGAGRARMFMTVVIPQLFPSLLSAALFAFLLSFDEVIISWFLAGVHTVTLPVKMYSSIQWEISPVIAAVSTLLTGLSLIVCVATVLLKRSTSIEA